MLESCRDELGDANSLVEQLRLENTRKVRFVVCVCCLLHYAFTTKYRWPTATVARVTAKKRATLLELNGLKIPSLESRRARQPFLASCEIAFCRVSRLHRVHAAPLLYRPTPRNWALFALFHPHRALSVSFSCLYFPRGYFIKSHL